MSSVIDVKKPDGFTALHLAAFNGHVEVNHYLFSQGAKECKRNDNYDNSDNYSTSDCECLWSQVAHVLLKNGCNKNIKTEQQQTPLHLAIDKMNMQMVQLLVREGCDLGLGDKDGDTPLHEAIRTYKIADLVRKCLVMIFLTKPMLLLFLVLFQKSKWLWSHVECTI